MNLSNNSGDGYGPATVADSPAAALPTCVNSRRMVNSPPSILG
jgi:hypothetical protein